MHELSRDLGPSYIRVITHYYFWSLLTWLINATKPQRSDVNVRHRCLTLMSEVWPVQFAFIILNFILKLFSFIFSIYFLFFLIYLIRI